MRFDSQSGGGVEALRNLNFKVHDGEFLTIVGPSGCGKSTTLRLISYLLRPTNGRVLIDDRPVDATPPSIGFMFQTALQNEFKRRGMPNQAATVVTLKAGVPARTSSRSASSSASAIAS